jgi:plastocyanin
MKRIILSIIILLVLLAGGYYLLTDKSEPVESDQMLGNKNQSIENENKLTFNFDNPKKSAHYESNTPAHGSILAAAPINIVLDFNFDLGAPSAISIKKDGVEYGVGETIIDNNKLAMRRNFNSQAPDGLYKVVYNACWPDRSCHDGHFEFAIDRTSSNFMDLRNQKEITIEMSNIKFSPQNIRISPNTQITWINNDNVDHYVNTDSHPAHTYYLEQNSKALKKGESHTVTFTKTGIYPYHCSAHTEMTGSIIVD